MNPLPGLIGFIPSDVINTLGKRTSEVRRRRFSKRRSDLRTIWLTEERGEGKISTQRRIYGRLTVWNPGRLACSQRAGRRRRGVSQSPCNGSGSSPSRPAFRRLPCASCRGFPPISLPAALNPSTASDGVKWQSQGKLQASGNDFHNKTAELRQENRPKKLKIYDGKICVIFDLRYTVFTYFLIKFLIVDSDLMQICFCGTLMRKYGYFMALTFTFKIEGT